MEPSQLPIPSTMQGPVTTVATSYVSRVTLIEEAVILICIVLLAAALFRRGPKHIHLLLWGFILMPARDIVFHMSLTFGSRPEGMWAANAANVVSLVGWLLVAAYCLTVLWRPSTNTGQPHSAASRHHLSADG